MSASAQSKATILLTLGILLPYLLQAASAQEPPALNPFGTPAERQQNRATMPCRASSRPPTARSTRARSR